MQSKSKRNTFEVENYNPPPGHYSPTKHFGRMTDFGNHNSTQPIRPPLPQMVPQLPLLQPTTQLHGYARPRDRMEFNKKHKHQRGPSTTEVFLYQQPFPIDFKPCNPNFELVKPRIRGTIMAPLPQEKKTLMNNIENYFDPLMDEVLCGSRITQLTSEYHQSKQTQFDETTNQNSNYNDNSTQMYSQLVEEKEIRKVKLLQQRVTKKSKLRYNNAEDSLEALLMRDKFLGPDNAPGPGHYFLVDSAPKEGAPKITQPFKSRSIRFFSKNPEEIQRSELKYNFVSDFDRPHGGLSFDKMSGHQQQKQQNQIQCQSRNQNVPGVGQYSLQETNNKLNNSGNLLYPCAFGCGIKRFS